MSSEHPTQFLEQEIELQFAQFNNETAWTLGCAIKQETEKLSASVAIEIYAFEQVLFSYAMPETSKDHQDWVRRKRQSVLRYGHSSYYLGQYNASKQREFENQAHIDAREYCAHGGSFPIRIKGSGLVGAITVSGLPQADDHNLVVNTLRGYFAVD
ncbi:heme-degrading domain-containing protein [Vibrio mediterranei]